MASTVTIDLRHVVRGLGVPLPQVQAVVELLDEGNTVPFVARYRKDRTGGVDEELIREIQSRLTKTRFLAERKQTILRSIEAQGKLSEKLAKQIQSASTTKRLEDLYLPYKPKKQTLATLARNRGLEDLAREVLEADPAALNLDARAADFVNPDKKVAHIADALLGAGHILAEQISERAELRQRLREILQRNGKLVCARIEPDARDRTEKVSGVNDARADSGSLLAGADGQATIAISQPLGQALAQPEPVDPQMAAGLSAAEQWVVAEPAAEIPAAQAELALPAPVEPFSTLHTDAADAEPIIPSDEKQPASESLVEPVAAALEEPAPATPAESAPATAEAPLPVASVESQAILAISPGLPPAAAIPAPAAKGKGRQRSAKADRKASKAEQKKKKEEQKLKAFSDYYDYQEEIKKIPPHRVLAINRGERGKVLRVRIEADLEAMYQAIDELIVPAEHPHADFLRGCARDGLTRLTLPSLEREIRRELTERAETHAVGVFARNLRNLLLQPPVHDRRVLALDPAYKSGCKLAVLDPFGTVLDHGVIYLIGKDERRQEAARKVIEMITRHQVQVVVIGNGSACREAEDFVAGLIGKELAGQGVAYVIVNGAGASVYSTSRIGREEFPHYDASLRGAISIGRRLQDPLSELVKIEPANIGVGLYQHDVKAKHLSTSLDEVVESCVNYVGVNVNSASPALLRYVSGMNQLSARKVYEHRRQHGPFKSRQQLKEVPGIGEGTFVQAAGFLKIGAGEQPLDDTWIHPESYEVAARVLEKLGCAVADLKDKEKLAGLAQRVSQVNLDEMARELEVGVLTLRDILAQLARPGHDPREDLPAPAFKQGVLKLEDLGPGMELSGTILNVVDFGAFVDIGVHHSGLIHVSQMADKFIRDPHDVVAVGDIVKLWVLEVDKERRRVSLTMIPPGTQRMHSRGKPEARGPGRPPRPAPAGQEPEGQGQGQGQGTGEGQVQPTGDARSRGQHAERPPQRRSRSQGPPHRPQGGPPSRPRFEPRPRIEPKPRPKKPLVPITDEMKTGKVPLRSFGDLLQFYELKQDAPADGQPPETPATAKGPAAAETRHDAPADAPPPAEVAGPPVVETKEAPATPPPP